jgi:hypothetical protein
MTTISNPSSFFELPNPTHAPSNTPVTESQYDAVYGLIAAIVVFSGGAVLWRYRGAIARGVRNWISNPSCCSCRRSREQASQSTDGGVGSYQPLA